MKTMKKQMLIALALTLTLSANSQTLNWLNQNANTNYCDARTITKDATGNIFVAGIYKGTLDLDPGPGTNIVTSAGYYDIYIQKFASDGNLVWGVSVGGEDYDNVEAITTDKAGNLIITGDFISWSSDFDPGPGTLNLAVSPGANADVYVLKLDTDANLIWGKTAGGSEYAGSFDVITDSNNDIYVCGEFVDTVDFSFGGAPLDLTTTVPSSDGFIFKIDAGGNTVWAKQIASVSSVLGANSQVLAIDSVDNLYIAGQMSGTTDLDPGPGMYEISISMTTDFITYLIKLDDLGDFVWADLLQGNDYSYPMDMKINATGGINLLGFYTGTVDLDPTAGIANETSLGYSSFVLEWESVDGSFSWARELAADNQCIASGIDYDPLDNLIVLGGFSGYVDFDTSSTSDDLYTATTSAAFMCCISPSGDMNWTSKIEGIDPTDEVAIFGLVIDGDNLYGAGWLSGSADFDPGSGISNLTSLGDYDGFIMQMTLDPHDVGVIGADKSSDFILYPNPAGDGLVHVSPITPTASYQIRNSFGQLVQAGELVPELPINELASGVYYFSVRNQDELFTTKLIVK
ncbi:T9SS type A sorting domain-containing protein [Crocinitomix catalasitica]|nr:T9SS type A sorting domain-containing protein [Crocinitomix catalasitica]